MSAKSPIATNWVTPFGSPSIPHYRYAPLSAKSPLAKHSQHTRYRHAPRSAKSPLADSQVVLHGLHDLNEAFYPISTLICALAEFSVLISLEVHTDETLEWGHKVVQRLSDAMKQLVGNMKKAHTKSLAPNGQKSWLFPKAHATSHTFDDVCKKGALIHASTKPGERHHWEYWQMYLSSNKKNVDKQIVLKDQHKAVLKLIKRNIEHAEEYNAQQIMPREPSDDSHIPTHQDDEVIHIKLRSPHRHPYGLTLSMVEHEQTMAQHSIFKDFQHKTLNFLKTVYGLATLLPKTENITEYHLLEVAYESQVHWYTNHDLLCTNPNFYGQAHYDSVMVDTVNGPAFAQLVLMFGITPSSIIGTVQLALIRCYTPIHPSSCPLSDKPVSFRRFKLSEESSSTIISLESVICGVLVPTFLESSNGADTFFVNDLVDGDIFIRMRHLTHCS
ncbi:uncharacterized protein EI90DRAFT_3130601 [Cantharellus anzutake]|uniref:uncharacterized protein n=1 Tax=Cantharellus anzutake TaxID=1750568 RepID=UPI001904A9B5|nr:uncharacterized protein EI90DRAFT_3130601 [Cantharellus anzutake]KAF8322954.1 hypothetical protein EI90DRAFT_3130601 [Cantharellus anzutake]